MRAKIPTAKRCSAEFGRAFILRPAPSRLLLAWLVSAHMLAALGVLRLPLGWPWKAALLALLPLHAWLRRPAPPELIVRNRNGFWALPESGNTALRLSAASRYGIWWAELRLAGAQGAHRRLLCRDQLSQEEWRILKLALKRAASHPDLS